MATITDVTVGTAVTFLNSGKQMAIPGTIGSLSDNGRITLNITAGGTLTNVPHHGDNPYIGWYAVSPASEKFSTVVQVGGTTKHRVQS